MRGIIQNLKTFHQTFVAVIACSALVSCDDSVIYELFPPDDYFNPVLSVTIDPRVTVYSAPLVHKYNGMYSISLVLEKPNSVGDAYEFEQFKVGCAFDFEHSRVEVPCGIELLPFWGERSGISISTYQVPEAVPSNLDLEFQIEFKEARSLQKLEADHGSVTLKIEKWSDL